MGDSTINMTHAAADQVKACLNRVRIGLRAEKPEAYNPRSVSLGCFHSREYELNEFKCKNFPGSKLPNRDDELNKLSHKIIEVHGKDIREWYGPDQNYGYCSDRELGTNIAQDGLFLLQFLCQVSRKAAKNRKAPRYISQIKYYEVEEDIMKLENQIPLFVLKTVIEWEAQTYQWILTGDHVLKSILRRAVWHKLSPFASPFVPISVPVNYKSHLLEFVYDNIIAGFKPVSTGNSKRHQVRKRHNVCKRHQSLSHQVYSLSQQVLGFVYKKVIVLFESDSTGNDKRIDLLLPRVEQLHERGVKFAKQKGHDLYVSFDRKTCTLKLPAIKMEDRTDAVMRNLLAFEDTKNAEKPLTCYVVMMNRLIDKDKDVQLLRNKGIIHSDLGSDEEVAEIWNKMAKGLEKNTPYGSIDSVIDDVMTFYTSKYRILWAQFKEKHLSKPWLAVALIGGCISLVLSVAQTILAGEQVRLQRETMK